MIYQRRANSSRSLRILPKSEVRTDAFSINFNSPRLLSAALCWVLLIILANAGERGHAQEKPDVVRESAATPAESVLHSFSGGASDGELPQSKLISDSSGRLYGTTPTGGKYNLGTVFELTPSGSTWSESVIYSFGAPLNGANPYGGLTIDSAGNLYGTTTHGGAYGYSGGGPGYGTFFELSHVDGSWILTGLYSFEGGSDGFYPYNREGLVRDASGNFYGTTSQGGLSGEGTAFEIIPPPSGSTVWEKKILHNFADDAADGGQPRNSLILDPHGNLYGTTYYGGAHGHGTVYELSPNPPNQVWLETTLYSFGATSTDGIFPWCSLVRSATGNLYGTTTVGGLYTEGTVFEVTPGNPSIELTLYSFDGAKGDGVNPFSGLTTDLEGNLYGTTDGGGTYHLGTVYELSPGAPWKETILNSFGGINHGGDGATPQYGALMVDSNNNLYGTTYEGGVHNLGTVFKISQ